MQASLINAGTDLHLHHGPIDLIISAEGQDASIVKARYVAEKRFSTLLEGLVAELPILRQPVARACNVADPVAQRMWRSAVLFRASHFITPMAAVAGSVADEVLSAILAEVHNLTSVRVNNGGDIALWLRAGQSSTLGVADPLSGHRLARAVIHAHDGIGGIATSGRHGRSLSFGIADSVTVLAANAAVADAAATLIANAVDIPDNPNTLSKVQRVSAKQIDPDSDLGDRPVTVEVDNLTEADCYAALNQGLLLAEQLIKHKTINAAYLVLQGRCVITKSFKSLDYSSQANPLAKPMAKRPGVTIDA